MILKNKSFYRKFVDWWDNFVKDKPLITASANDVIFLICFFTLLILLFLFDPVWRPFLHYYFPDSVPLMDYQPYTP
jgi:hypothetical protein